MCRSTSTWHSPSTAYRGLFANTFGETWCDGLVVEWGPHLRAAMYGPYGEEALYEIRCRDLVFSAVTYTSDRSGDMSPGGFVAALFDFIARHRQMLETVLPPENFVGPEGIEFAGMPLGRR